MSKGVVTFWLIMLVLAAAGIGARLALGDWPWQAVWIGSLFAFIVSQLGQEIRKGSGDDDE